MERAEFIWGRILFEELWEPVRFSVWRLQWRITLFESSRPCRLFSSMSFMIQNQSIFQFTLWRWLLTMFVRVFVFLHSVWVCFWVRLCLWFFVHLWFIALFCVQWFLIENFFDCFLKVIIAVKLLQMQLLFWSQCYLCSSIVGLE